MKRLPRIIAALVTAMTATSAMAQAPPSTPAPGDPVPLARYITRDGLIGYIEVLGTEAKAAEWSQTAASKILNDTSTGAMLDSLMVQLLDRMFASMPDSANPGFTKPTGEEYMGLIRHCLREGMVLGIHPNAATPSGMTATVVFRGAMRDDTSKRVFAALIRGVTPAGSKTTKVVKPGNRSVAVITRDTGKVELYFWVENKMDLVLTDNPDMVVAALDGKAPNALESPARTEAFAEADGFVPMAAAWIEPAGFPPVSPQASQAFDQMGLKGVKRVDVRFGTRGEALMNEIRLVSPRPRTGLLAMIDQPGQTLQTMPAMPAGIKEFTAFSVDLPKLYDDVQTLARASNPQAGAAFEKMEATVKARTRLQLKEDLLSHLGPKMVVYAEPKAKPSGGLFGALGGGGVQVPKGALVMEIKDAKATTTMIDQLMIFVNKEIKTQMAALMPPPTAGAEGGRRSSSAPPVPEFKVTINNPKTYLLNLPTQYAAMTNLRLTVAVGKKSMVIASMPDAAREALAAEGRTEDNALDPSVTRATEGLPAEFTMLNVSDPSDTLPEGLARLPMSLNALLAPPAMPGAPGPGQGPPPGPDERGPRGGRQPALPGGGGGRQPASPGGGGRQPASPGGGGGDGPVPPSMLASVVVGQNPPDQGPAPIMIDPASIPSPDVIRPLLFPSASEVVVDENSVRFVAKFAFPDIAGLVDAITAARGAQALTRGAAGMPGPGRPPGPGVRPNAPPPGGNQNGPAGID